MIYPPQGQQPPAQPPPQPQLQLSMLKYDRQVSVADTNSAVPKISLTGNFIPLQFHYALSNLEFGGTMYYRVEIELDGTTKTIDQGSIGFPESREVNRVIHDIERFVLGQDNIFQHLEDGKYFKAIRVYAWFPTTPVFGGLARLIVVGVKW